MSNKVVKVSDLWTLVAIIASGLITGITGFGFGLISMGILAALMPVTRATAIVAILTLVVTLLNLWTIRHEVLWREILPILVTALPAIAVGVRLLIVLDARSLSIGVGVMILAGCLGMVWTPQKAIIRRAFPWAVLAGLIGGLFGGALGTGGPPVVFYELLRGWDKSQSKSTLCAYFTVTSIWRVTLLIVQGVITPEIARTSALLLIPAIASTYLGVLIFRRISTPVFRHITMALLLGLAAKLLIS